MRILFAIDKTRFAYLIPFTKELSKLGIECKIIDDLDIYGNSIFDKKYFRWVKTPEKFKEIIKKYKPDLVFTERASHFSLLTIKSEIPLCIFLRGNPWEEYKFAKKIKSTRIIDRINLYYKNKIAEKCYKNSTMILPICKFLEDIVIARYPRKKISVLYQGIELSEWFTQERIELKHPCVGLLQNAMIWGKTQEMLTLRKVLESMPEVTFYWVGDGPYREKILPELNKYENFKWLGAMQYPDKVREYLASIDVYALMSGMDMMPHTILEAAAMKKPIIATNVGGIPEIMNEMDDLIGIGDHKEWVERISKLIRDNENLDKEGLEAYDFVKNKFRWEIIAKKFVYILDSFGIK